MPQHPQIIPQLVAKGNLALAEARGAWVQVVAAYDSFLHKTLFHELEDALTEEARQVFNTEAQQKLHDELIDSGIAKIYSDHLETARRIAAEVGGFSAPSGVLRYSV